MQRIKKPKAIISDWDDTKVETFAGVSGLYMEFAKHHELLIPTLEAVQMHWGKPLPELFIELWGDDQQKIMAQFWQYVHDTDYSVKPFPFTREAILKLQAMDLLLSVVSSGPRKEMLKTLERHIQLPENTFLIIQGHDESLVHKPDPAVFDQTFAKLNELGIKEDETIYVGDGLRDLEAAQKRGIHFVAVTTGLITSEQFIAAGMDQNHILNNFGELPAYLEKS